MFQRHNIGFDRHGQPTKHCYWQSPTKSICTKPVYFLGQPDLLSQFPSQSFETIWDFFGIFSPNPGLDRNGFGPRISDLLIFLEKGCWPAASGMPLPRLGQVEMKGEPIQVKAGRESAA